jgi:hypothetical protein
LPDISSQAFDDKRSDSQRNWRNLKFTIKARKFGKSLFSTGSGSGNSFSNGIGKKMDTELNLAEIAGLAQTKNFSIILHKDERNH